MATNKTLAPTGVTVQIPAMSDPPSMAVPANAIDKTIDAVNALNSQIVSMPYFGTVQNKTISLNQTSGFYVADFSDLTAPTVTGRTFVGYVGFIDTYRAAVLGFGGQRCYYNISAPTTADATVKVYPMYI